MNGNDIAWAFNNLGFPGILCFMLWRVLVFCKPIVLNKIVPMCENIGNKHVEFLDKTSVALDNTHKTLTTVLGNQEEFQGVIRTHSKQIGEIHDAVVNRK